MTSLIKEALEAAKIEAAQTNNVRLYNILTAAEIQLKDFLNVKGYVDVVFDAPPGPESGKFVELEDRHRKGISFGEWIKREDGYWALRIPLVGWSAENHDELQALRRDNKALLEQPRSQIG